MPLTVVAGGGIVGLTTALELRRAGHDVIVFERSDTLRADGAGLALWPSALAILDRHGVASELIANAGVLAQTSRTPDGDVLVRSSDLDEVAGFPSLCIYRQVLVRILGEAVGLDSIRLSSQVVGFDEGESSVEVRLADGTTQTADLLVGSDGIWSAVRGQLFPDAKPEYQGQTMWRAVIPTKGLDIDGEHTLVVQSGVRGGWMDVGRGMVYWFVGIFQPAGVARQDAKHRELLDLVGDWDSPLRRIIEATPEDEILLQDLNVLPPIERLGSRLVAITGDAGHGLSPQAGAYGACLVIEDALVLGDALRGSASIAQAIDAYDLERQPRIQWAYSHSVKNMSLALENAPSDEISRSSYEFLKEAIRTSPGIASLT